MCRPKRWRACLSPGAPGAIELFIEENTKGLN